jgi:DUF4097 and DUF4098 domain-containing protein YvlB
MRASEVGRHHVGVAPELIFPVPAHPVVRVTTRSGQVVVIGEHRQDVLVEGTERADVTTDGTLEVSGGSSSVEVRCPGGTDVIVGTGSGSVDLRGRLGDARVTVGSGSISVDEVERLDARTGSGSFEVESCGGDCRLKTGSGSIRVGRAGNADLATGSGSVEAELVDAAVIRSGSGNVDVGLAGPGRVDVKAHSGSVTVSVPSGVRPAATLRSNSGKVQCDCQTGHDGEVRVRTLSGSILVAER